MTRDVPDGDLDRLTAGLSALSRLVVGITAVAVGALDVELTLTQHRMIVLLATTGPRRTVDLAGDLGVHPSTASRTGDRLVRRGLLARRRLSDDRRVSWLHLTDRGRDLVAEIVRRRTAELRRLLAAVPAEARRTPADLMDALVLAAGEPSEPAWWQHWATSSRPPGADIPAQD
ncbi:MarR family winged helix-turn-helix transcriptional regulator [Plantactinospora siamensis]|uniref:MarR family winged helix-turn-helix transcriptional regulator n=1 Tax=Plantactinospora siamensis TaxID=555372 RepID=A0ABV6NRN9_9ACTN